MKTVAIFFNKDKEKASQTAEHLSTWLTEHHYRYIIEDVHSSCEDNLLKADYIISLGGDGTTLRAARLASSHNIPILGVSLGTLGFLAEVSIDNLFEAIKKIEDKQYRIDERSMLALSIMEDNKKIEKAIALNEIVLSSPRTKMLLTDVSVSGHYLTTYAADGLIVSTPTGSTAYNLSAGGPILSPLLDATIITPICAHSLNLRSLVVDGREKVLISPHDPAKFKEAIVSIDGQFDITISSTQTLKIKKANKKIQFIRFDEFCFFEAMRSKLKWSGKSH